jgi:hypothetical protein
MAVGAGPMTDAWKRNISSQQVTGLLMHSLLNYWYAFQMGAKTLVTSGVFWRSSRQSPVA